MRLSRLHPSTVSKRFGARKFKIEYSSLELKTGSFFFAYPSSRHYDFCLCIALVIHQTLAEVLDQEEKFLSLFLPRTVSATRNFEPGAAEARHFHTRFSN